KAILRTLIHLCWRASSRPTSASWISSLGSTSLTVVWCLMRGCSSHHRRSTIFRFRKILQHISRGLDKWPHSGGESFCFTALMGRANKAPPQCFVLGQAGRFWPPTFRRPGGPRPGFPPFFPCSDEKQR